MFFLHKRKRKQCEKCLNTEFFVVFFSGIRTKFGKIQATKNSAFGHLHAMKIRKMAKKLRS